MKYLSDYMQDKQTEVFNKYGVFFAFSDKQYEEKAVKGVKYASMGAGMVAPAKHAQLIFDALETIHDDAVKADEIFTTLMGDEVPPRKAFILSHAQTVRNLDV